MFYIIDSANTNEIDEVLSLGINAITANASMYHKHDIGAHEFLHMYANRKLSFLSGEVMNETYEDMLKEAMAISAIDQTIIIKINFSKAGLRLATTLHARGIKTAMTLLFSVPQCIAAIHAHVDYLFFFIGRNEEQGVDALHAIHCVQQLIVDKNLPVKLVGASIKNLYQLERLANLHIDYVAIPYDLYMKSLVHPLTTQGIRTFQQDWQNNTKNF